MRIAVVVVNFYTGPVLGDCLRRALACPEVAELVLVDNGSPSGEIDALITDLADKRVLKIDLPSNPGFAIACNRGARLAHSPWLLFLNPDCLIEADTLTRLAKVALTHEHLGILGALLVDAQGRPDSASARLDPKPARAIATAFGVDRLFGLEGVSLAIPANGREPLRADAISGALMLVRREAFNATRGFDEGYFMHGEDLDLCRRVRELDFEVWCDPSVKVVHLKGVSSRRNPIRVQLAKHRGLLRYFDKFDAPRMAWPLRLLIRMGAFGRLALGVLRSVVWR